jgi:hypothetical protein
MRVPPSLPMPLRPFLCQPITVSGFTMRSVLRQPQNQRLVRIQNRLEADWEARIRQLDPNATTIPQVLPSDTPIDRIARFAKAGRPPD